MSAPHSPGGVSLVSASRSEATTTFTLAAAAFSAMPCTRRRRASHAARSPNPSASAHMPASRRSGSCRAASQPAGAAGGAGETTRQQRSAARRKLPCSCARCRLWRGTAAGCRTRRNPWRSWPRPGPPPAGEGRAAAQYSTWAVPMAAARATTSTAGRPAARTPGPCCAKQVVVVVVRSSAAGLPPSPPAAAPQPRATQARPAAAAHLEAQPVCAGLADGDGLRVALVRDQELGLLAARHRRAHGHRLCRRGGLIQQAGIRHGHTRQVRHHGLEVEQGLQAGGGRRGGREGRRQGVGGRVGRRQGGVVSRRAEVLCRVPRHSPAPALPLPAPCHPAHRPWLISAW